MSLDNGAQGIEELAMHFALIDKNVYTAEAQYLVSLNSMFYITFPMVSTKMT